MKTDIFKDLAPLKDMTWVEVSQVAYGILNENKDRISKSELRHLIDKTEHLIKVIKASL